MLLGCYCCECFLGMLMLNVKVDVALTWTVLLVLWCYCCKCSKRFTKQKKQNN